MHIGCSSFIYVYPRKASCYIWDGNFCITNKPAVPPALRYPVVSPLIYTYNGVHRTNLLLRRDVSNAIYSRSICQLRNVLLPAACQ